MIKRSQQLEDVLNAAAEVVAKAQQPSGGFLSLSSPHPTYPNPLTYNTTFFTSVILGAISSSEEPLLLQVKRNALDFLLSQRSPLESFNYWNRHAEEFIDLPYPDDLDDTFAAWGAMAVAEPECVTGEVLAHIVQLLTTQEEKPGGPYRTWLVNENAASVWRDIDLAVNSNIAWFLLQQKVKVPGLKEFIEQRIEQENYRSPYYPSIFPVTYFLSRGYSGSLCDQVCNFLLKHKRETKEPNPLDTALLVCSLLRLGVDVRKVEPIIDHLVKNFLEHGFSAHPFCLDPAQAGEKYFAGAASLTAAIHYEMVSMYLAAIDKKQGSLVSNNNQPFYEEVISSLEKKFQTLPPSLASLAKNTLKLTLQHDSDKQIVQLPLWFAQSLTGSETLARQELVSLGSANLYGWIAYTIYDNIIDEQKEINLLPLANICLRQVIKIYQALGSGFQPLFGSIMERLEAANSWEINRTRRTIKNGQMVLTPLPDYGDYTVLAEKSLGHALGPLGVMYKLGYAADSSEMQTVLKMFEHYLIARQLNDDAHDWQDDLASGQLNSVATMVLSQALDQGIVGSKINLKKSLPDLQELFWSKIINEVGKLILQHTQLAHTFGNSLNVMVQLDWLERMLKPLEQAVKQATTEAAKAKEFLSAYKTTS